MSIKIVIADDHSVVRDGIKMLLNATQSIVVVGESADGITAIRLAEELSPDVIVMDSVMPYINGVQATSEIKKKFPLINVIGLSAHSETNHIIDMLKAGASGYLMKSCSSTELINAIHAVNNGNSYMPTEISELIVEFFQGAEKHVDQSYLSKLTSKERIILQLLADGMSSKESGFALNISAKTVNVHRENIKKKLSINSIAGLTKYAIKAGLTTY